MGRNLRPSGPRRGGVGAGRVGARQPTGGVSIGGRANDTGLKRPRLYPCSVRARAACRQSPTFEDLGLETRRSRRCSEEVGYESPSPIQAEAIPPLLAGQHVVGLAQTGTGKTAAFALPILSRIDLSQKSPQALVLAPTRELALQVSEAFGRYATHLKGLHLLPVYGGQGYGVQLSALRRGVHVVVGTPGRVMDHLEKGTLDLSGLRFVVLDEADEMLNMGFAEDVETILADTPEDKQLRLVQARRSRPRSTARHQEVRAGRHRDHRQVHDRRPRPTSPSATSRSRTRRSSTPSPASSRWRTSTAMIVFVRTKQRHRGARRAAACARASPPPRSTATSSQAQRERTIDQLRKGKLDILVATDVAARGLDVERISHVINHDIPTDTESYVHRIGRTGRAGRSGQAISFVTPREQLPAAGDREGQPDHARADEPADASRT